MDKLRKVLSGRDDEEEGIVTQINEATTFSWSTRIKGFVICFAVGIVLSVLGTVMIFFNNWTAFALLYTFGNIIALSSTCFLMGPFKQIKNMFAHTRIIATIVMLLCLVLTIMAAVWWKFVV